MVRPLIPQAFASLPDDPTVATLFAGLGEMRARCRRFDWSTTPLGPVAQWSHSLRTTVDTMLATPHPMFLWWGAELVQIFNDGYLPSFGTSGRDIGALGARGREHWMEIWPIIGPQIDAVMTRGESTWHEDHLVPILRNGRLEDVWWTYSYSPVRDDDGAIGGVLVIVQETTAHVRAIAEREQLLTAERVAREEAESLRVQAESARARVDALFRQAPAFIAVMRGPQLIFDLANDAYYQLVGHRDLIGKPAFEALPDARGQGFEEMLQRVVDTGEAFVGREMPIALVRAPGAPSEQRFVNFVYAALTEPNGERSGVFAHGVDVTDQVHARQAIEATAKALAISEARLVSEVRARTMLSAALAQASEFVAMASADGRALFMNAAGRQLVGLSPDEPMHAHSMLEFFAPEWQQRVRDEYVPALVRDGVWVGELAFKHWPTGDSIPAEWRAFVVRDETSGEIVALACTARDLRNERAAIAERERLLGAEREARTDAEEANRAKSDFLAVMSHELRTPLNAIGGYAELLELGIHGPVTTDQAKALARIQQSQRHLLGLINGVLNYSRVEAGAVLYAVAEVPLDEVVATCEALVAPQVRDKALVFFFAGCDPSLAARADREKVQQVLLNLLSNAVKFTEPGGSITVECGEVDEHRIAVRVRDTGHGIAMNQLERVFQPFVQVDAKLTRTHEGTGLGLAISRDLALGMGGDLTVESTLGVGSTFTLTLPAA